MPTQITITLASEPIIDKLELDIAHRRVIVHYRILTDAGELWKKGRAVLVPNLPSDPAPPDNFGNLPSAYVTEILGMRDAASAFVANMEGLT